MMKEVKIFIEQLIRNIGIEDIAFEIEKTCNNDIKDYVNYIYESEYSYREDYQELIENIAKELKKELVENGWM